MGFGLLLLASLGMAADRVQGANLLGMGAVGVAAPADNAGITLNPGLLALRERFDFHAHARLGPELGRHWAASAVDAKTTGSIAAGIAISGDRYEPPLSGSDAPAWSVAGQEIRNRKRLLDFAGALAVPLFERRVSLGVGGVLNTFEHDQQGQGRLFDMHAGIGISPVSAVTVGVSARNFLAHQYMDRPLELAAGIRVEDPENVAVEVNIGRGWDQNEWVAAAGLASLPHDAPSEWNAAVGVDKRLGALRVRAGGAWLGASRTPYATFGLGSHESDGGGFEYAVVVPVTSGVTFGSTVHQLSVRFSIPTDIGDL